MSDFGWFAVICCVVVLSIMIYQVAESRERVQIERLKQKQKDKEP